MLDATEATRLLKTGKIIIVRAKNGHCIPFFEWRPSAYRCHIGKRAIAGDTVKTLLKRRLIEPVTRGWYSEGHFRFNANLRDERGRFRAARS